MLDAQARMRHENLLGSDQHKGNKQNTKQPNNKQNNKHKQKRTNQHLRMNRLAPPLTKKGFKIRTAGSCSSEN